MYLPFLHCLLSDLLNLTKLSDKNVEVVKNVGTLSTVAYSDSSVEIVSDRSKEEDGNASDGSKNTRSEKEMNEKEVVLPEKDVTEQKEIIDGNASDGSKNTRNAKEVVVPEKENECDVSKEKEIIDGNANEEMNVKEGVVSEKDSDQKESKDSDRSDSTSVTDTTDSLTESTDPVGKEKRV